MVLGAVEFMTEAAGIEVWNSDGNMVVVVVAVETVGVVRVLDVFVISRATVAPLVLTWPKSLTFTYLLLSIFDPIPS